jgi:hypothetical protein
MGGAFFASSGRHERASLGHIIGVEGTDEFICPIRRLLKLHMLAQIVKGRGTTRPQRQTHPRQRTLMRHVGRVHELHGRRAIAHPLRRAGN